MYITLSKRFYLRLYWMKPNLCLYPYPDLCCQVSMSVASWLKTFDWSTDHPLDPAVVHPATTQGDEVGAAAKKAQKKKRQAEEVDKPTDKSAMTSALLSAAKAAADAVAMGAEGTAAEAGPGTKKRKKKGEEPEEDVAKASETQPQPVSTGKAATKGAPPPSKTAPSPAKGVQSPSKNKAAAAVAAAGEKPSVFGKVRL